MTMPRKGPTVSPSAPNPSALPPARVSPDNAGTRIAPDALAEGRLRGLFNALDDALIMANARGEITEVNDAARRLLPDLPERGEPITLRAYVEAYPLRHPNAEALLTLDALLLRGLANATLRGQEVALSVNAERPTLAVADVTPLCGVLKGEDAPDGGHDAQKVDDSADNIVGALLTLRLPKTQAEAKREEEIYVLRQRIESAERERVQYRTLLETLPQFVWATNPDGKTTYMSGPWSEFTGTPNEDLLGDGWQRDLHAHDRARVANVWRIACETGSGYEVEYRLRGKNGVYRRFLARGTPIRDAQGKPVQMVGTTTDITAQVRERDRDRLLRQVGDRLRGNLDAPQTLKAIARELGEFAGVARVYYADVDEAAQTMTIHSDYADSETLPPIVGVMPLRVLPGVLQAFRLGQTLAFEDLATDPRTREFFADNFAPFQVRSLLTVPLRKDGRWVSTLILADDSPRHWTDEDVELAEALGERTSLAVENAQLAQAEREKAQRLSEAFAETHHRVKNNLQVIASLLDMRVMDDDPAAPPISRDDLKRMVGNVRAIAAVHDFLSLHQAAMTVSARDIVKRLVPMGAQTTGIIGKWQSEDATLSVKQGTALALVLNELISNAGKHGAKSVQVTLAPRETGMRLEVRDDGPGFPSGFAPDENAHLGLALVVSLAERDLQGRIEFCNNEEGGGCVRLDFTPAPS